MSLKTKESSEKKKLSPIDFFGDNLSEEAQHAYSRAAAGAAADLSAAIQNYKKKVKNVRQTPVPLSDRVAETFYRHDVTIKPNTALLSPHILSKSVIESRYPEYKNIYDKLVILSNSQWHFRDSEEHSNKVLQVICEELSSLLSPPASHWASHWERRALDVKGLVTVVSQDPSDSSPHFLHLVPLVLGADTSNHLPLFVKRKKLRRTEY